ncbi:MAG: AAA family ATPase [Treponema sp.]|nr:AAA family ATPase [Treponema sp.]
MKPLFLKMYNVGPFRDEEIDFSKLDSLFLITGKTGSGKSTIFDCITYALYGNFAGGRNQQGYSKSFISKYAKKGEESFVEFIFETGEKIYRIKRTLPYEYLNNRGNYSQKEVAVSLEVKINGTWEEYPIRLKKDIDDKIKNDILHLNMEEFKRIILLPQGEFAEFLRQNTNERRNILAKLFPVDEYTKIAELAKTRASEYEKEISTREQSFKITFGENFSTEKATEEKKVKENRINEINLEINSLDADNKSIITNLEKTRLTLESQKEAEKLKSKIAELEKSKNDIDEKRLMLSLYDKAKSLAVFVDKADDSKKRKADFEAKEKSLRQKSEAAKLALEELGKDSNEIEELKIKLNTYPLRVKEIKEKLLSLQTYYEYQKKEKTILSDYDVICKKIENNSSLVENKKSEINKIFEKWEINSSDENEALRLLVEKKSEYEKLFSKSKERLSCIEKLKANISVLKENTDKINALKDEEIEQNNALSVNNKELEALIKEKEAAHQANYASVLSKLLKDGEACPVCGSLTHPRPAIAIDDVKIEDRISSTELNIKNAEKILKEIEKDKSVLESKNETVESDIVAGVEQLNLDDSKRDLEALESVENSEKALNEKYADNMKILDKDYKQAVESVKSISSVKKEIEHDSSKKAEAEKELSAVKAKLESLEDLIGECEDKAKLDNELSEINKNMEEADKRIKKFDDEKASLTKTASSLEGELTSIEQSLKDVKVEEEENIKVLEEELNKSDFDSVQAVKDALLDASTAERFDSMIKTWDSTLARDKVLLSEKDKNQNVAELEESIATLADKEKIYKIHKEELEEEKNSLQVEKKSIEDKIKSVAVQQVELEKIRAASKVYVQLSNDLNGINGKKIPFDAWILAMYFNDIVAAANPRFYKLSSGRYQFKINEEAVGGTSYKGLDLIVYDSYTSSYRQPSSLSGGETFQASICLALAMTDVVQSRSGGIKLDSLFIDEGFGSLDPDALEKAMSILQGIRQHRTVGIISHVEEMKAAIPSHIEVNKTRKGSKIKIK